MKQGSDEWFEARKGKVTSSRITAIAGMSPYKTRDDVMREMVREHFGAEPEFKGNQFTRWGAEHEDVAAKEAEAADKRLKLEKCGFIEHPDFDGYGSSPDRVGLDDGAPIVAEIKCPATRAPEPLASRLDYKAQIMWHLICMPAVSHAVYIAWDQAVFIHIERVERDNTLISQLTEAAAVFYADFLGVIQAKNLYQPHLDPKVTPRKDADWLQASADWLDAKVKLDAAATAEKDAKEALLALSGGQSCEGGGVRVEHFEVAGSIDWKKAAESEGIDGEPFRKKGRQQSRITAI